MAAILDDGPRVWVVDTLNRKLGRVVAAAAAVGFLAQMHLIPHVTVRTILALGAVTLVAYACRPQPTNPAATIDDLAEVEQLVMNVSERLDGHLDDDDIRFNELTVLVREIRDQVRSR